MRGTDDGDQLQGAHFPKEVILMGVRWYLTYPLSTCHVEELREERGVELDHATINRWIVKYRPQLEAQFHRRKRPVTPRFATQPLLCGLSTSNVGTMA